MNSIPYYYTTNHVEADTVTDAHKFPHNEHQAKK